MLALTTANIAALRSACRSLGETRVTVVTDAGVITFDFGEQQPGGGPLPYESQPDRQQLAAMLGVPLTAATA